MKMTNNTDKKTYKLRVDLSLKVIQKIYASNPQEAEDILYNMNLNELLKGDIVDWENSGYLDFTQK